MIGFYIFVYWLSGVAGAFAAWWTCSWSIDVYSGERPSRECVTPAGIFFVCLIAIASPLLWLAALCYATFGISCLLLPRGFWNKPLCKGKRK